MKRVPRRRPAYAQARWGRALGVWLVIIAAESLHGALRSAFLAPALGDLRSRQIGVAIGAGLILAIAFAFAHWLHLSSLSTEDLLAIGALWLILTLTAELYLGRYVFRYSMKRITEDFDPRRGGLLPLGLIALFLAPLAVSRLRRWRSRRRA